MRIFFCIFFQSKRYVLVNILIKSNEPRQDSREADHSETYDQSSQMNTS